MYYEGFPYFATDAIEYLIDNGMRVMALDTPSPDDGSAIKVKGETDSPNHIRLLENKVLVIEYLNKRIIKNDKSIVVDVVKDAIVDSYKRLIEPSIEREIRSDLTEIGEAAAIDNFGKNLESLLLTPPMKDKVVLAFDPGYVNGCKIAVIDKTGKLLDTTTVDSITVSPYLTNTEPCACFATSPCSTTNSLPLKFNLNTFFSIKPLFSKNKDTQKRVPTFQF